METFRPIPYALVYQWYLVAETKPKLPKIEFLQTMEISRKKITSDYRVKYEIK